MAWPGVLPWRARIPIPSAHRSSARRAGSRARGGSCSPRLPRARRRSGHRRRAGPARLGDRERRVDQRADPLGPVRQAQKPVAGDAENRGHVGHHVPAGHAHILGGSICVTVDRSIPTPRARAARLVPASAIAALRRSRNTLARPRLSSFRHCLEKSPLLISMIRKPLLPKNASSISDEGAAGDAAREFDGFQALAAPVGPPTGKGTECGSNGRRSC
jgi:hypothetical protein